MDTSRAPVPGSSLLDTYPIRIMVGLVASLGLTIGLVHLPLHPRVQRVGWSAQPAPEQIVLDEVTSDRSGESAANEPAQGAPPVTDLQSVSSNPSSEDVSPEESGPPSAERDSEWAAQYKDLESIAELSTAEKTPGIVGGTGSLYLQINYPTEAIAQGIEGNLELAFTVEADGSVTEMEVINSLHPLCDSAAVAGVRAVQFVPATHDGTPIPMRLRLPVKFRLAAVSGTASTSGSSP